MFSQWKLFDTSQPGKHGKLWDSEKLSLRQKNSREGALIEE